VNIKNKPIVQAKKMKILLDGLDRIRFENLLHEIEPFTIENTNLRD